MSDCSHTIEQQLISNAIVAMKASGSIIDALLAKNLNPSTLEKEQMASTKLADVKKGGRCQKMGDIALHLTPLPSIALMSNHCF